MKRFCFTIDDNIRFLKELTERNCTSIFDHPYVALLKRLHERFDLKIQLNLFYRMSGFDLSQMSDCYASEWAAISDWLKFSFHSDREISVPYENAGYEEVLPFAHFGSLKIGKTVTVRTLTGENKGTHQNQNEDRRENTAHFDSKFTQQGDVWQ